MSLTPELRRNIDQIRDYLYGAGYPDPLNNAEQLSFLFFFYLVEGIDEENKDLASIRGKEGSAWVRRVLGDQPSDNRRRQAPEGGDISGNVSQ